MTELAIAAGMSKQQLYGYESGRRHPKNHVVLVRLARALAVPIESLI